MAIWARKLGVSIGGGEPAVAVSLEVGAGEVGALVGGSYETRRAVAMTLLGRNEALSGTCGLGEFQDAVGYVAARPKGRYEGLKVERVLGYAAELGLRDEAVEVRGARVEAMIEALGLEAQRGARLRDLSESERWKVEVGECALMGARAWIVEVEGQGRKAKVERMREVWRGGAVLLLSASREDVGEVAQVWELGEEAAGEVSTEPEKAPESRVEEAL